MPLKKLKRAATKAVKTVTRPIAKVLDKVVPNELKPFLPYVAAVAPVLGPKLGILSKLTKAQAAGLYGGGALFSQLAQEGSEGDFDLAPILAAAGTAFLAQPGTGISSLQMAVPGQTSLYPELTFGEKIKNIGIQGLQAAEKFTQAEGIGATAKALAPTVSTQVTQDAVNFAKQAEADFLAEQAEFNRLAGEEQEASDADRRSAIKASMLRANFTQDVIDETLDQLGLLLKDGGRVGYQTGGRASLQDFQNALRSVGAGTTYQQQAQAKDFARNEANRMLTEAFRSGNQQSLQNLYNQFGFNTTAPGSQLFRRGTTSGTLDQIIGLPAAKRDRVLDQMAQRMLSYPTGGSSARPTKSPLQLKIEENQRIYDEYIKNNPPRDRDWET